ncbi:MAG TPA: sensor histidine kinase [Streptosporangiaceae bacterium]|jgi:signal transduction histidine kinase|nr:sensor histidine kinase [Streptosporangiaceae bacterium]
MPKLVPRISAAGATWRLGTTPDDPEQRLEKFLRLAPFALLVISTIPYLLTQHPTAADVGRTIGAEAVTAAWVLWWVILHEGWHHRLALMAVFFAGFVLCCGLLVARSPWFGFFCWVGYPLAFLYLRGWLRYVGIVLIAAASALAQLGGFHPPTPPHVALWLVVTALNGVLVTTFIYLGEKAENQNQERKQTVTDLAEANARLEEMMAENTGLHAQLLTQAREAGVLEERQRMAREIHDTLAQGLTGIITQLEAVQQAGPAGPAGSDWERRIATAARLARHSLSEARRSVRAVRPESLENTRLPEALADVAGQWSENTGVSAGVITTGTVLGLHPEIEVTLLRVAQEALANVAKHADATRVGITLSYMEDVVSLDIRDDGVGFRPGQRGAPDSAGGFGLTGMQQRVRRLAGSLAIESEPGHGTAISASVPAILRAGATTMETPDE